MKGKKDITLSQFQLFTKSDIDKIIKEWDTYGFCEGLVEPKLTNVAIAFEATANIIVNSINHKYSTETSMIAFPIVRRIIQKEEDEMPISIIVQETINILDKIEKEIHIFIEDEKTNLDKFNIDAEAEFCSAFSDNYKLYF